MSNLEEEGDGTEPEPTLTMVDYYEETMNQEIKAIAVLGPTEGDHCTYDRGYLKRQGLYSCRTCQKNSEVLAGVCVPCSYACHDGHELVELYTKRDFRCDCGNSKFPQGNPCKLNPNKEKLNEENKYGHNFLGLYCTCNRPWPDDENYDPVDTMFQCTVCEDWFHPKHLGAPCPPQSSFDEVICQSCSNKLPFLGYYSMHIVTGVVPEKGLDGDETSLNDSKESVDIEVAKDDRKQATEVKNELTESVTPKDNQQTSFASTEQPGPSTSSDECILEGRSLVQMKEGATFLTEHCRASLCTCSQCKAMYKRLGVSFLPEREDTLAFHEEKAIRARETAYEKGMKALSTLPRMSQVECLQNFAELKSELTEYLSPFAASKKVVRKEDIMDFFSQLQARKRRRLDGAPPFACR